MESSQASDWIAKRIIAPLHLSLVSHRRVDRLVSEISSLLDSNERLTGLDIGCGSGEITGLIQKQCPSIELSGVEVLIRQSTFVPITKFDGEHLPFPDKSFDFTLLIDVLHHLKEPLTLLAESTRVSRKFVILKDHCSRSPIDFAILSLMDWVGNRAHDVHLPYNYQSEGDWLRLFESCGLTVETQKENLRLYPPPFTFLFDRQLHFIARCRVGTS